MKIPIKIDGTEVVCEVFSQIADGVTEQQCDRIVTIEGRTYRVRATENGTFYTMFSIGGHQRTVRGSFDRILRVVGLQHLIYRRYETRVQKLKEEAQRLRDRQLNELAEASG